jgi:hypothetical protein
MGMKRGNGLKNTFFPPAMVTTLVGISTTSKKDWKLKAIYSNISYNAGNGYHERFKAPPKNRQRR